MDFGLGMTQINAIVCLVSVLHKSEWFISSDLQTHLQVIGFTIIFNVFVMMFFYKVYKMRA
jgi:hypothetical protein